MNIWLVYLIITSIIQGASARRTRNTAIIFGTKESVISCICVTALMMLTTRPTTMPTISTGAETMRITSIVSLPMLVTNSGVTSILLTEALYERADQQVPAVDQHEEHELKGHRYHYRREHHHAHRHEDARHDHIYDQKGHVYEEAYLEGSLQLACDKGRYQREGRYLVFCLRGFGLGKPQKKLHILRPRVLEHELSKRLYRAGEGRLLGDGPCHVGLERRLIDFCDSRGHYEKSKEEREAHYDLVGRRLLDSERLSQKRKHHD